MIKPLRKTPDFLSDYPDYEINFLASDMSTRCYYRLTAKDGKSIVLMDAQPPENPSQFVRLADYLNNYGLSAPKIIAKDDKNGFLLLEDFGDHTFNKLLQKNPEVERELYEIAIGTLRHIHQQIKTPPSFTPVYTIDLLVKEATLLLEWYWSMVYSNKTPPLESYQKLWQQEFIKTKELPFTLVLRDFHVDNLMLLADRPFPKNCGLLDFQDAIWGPAVIDIVSLLEDARRDVPEKLQQEMWQLYLQDIPTDQHEYWLDAAAILSAGRHARIIGVFSRYLQRNKSDRYMEHLPRLWRLLRKSLSNKSVNLHNWFAEYFPKEYGNR